MEILLNYPKILVVWCVGCRRPTNTARTLYELPCHIIKLQRKQHLVQTYGHCSQRIPLKFLQTRRPFIGYTDSEIANNSGKWFVVFFFLFSKQIKQVVNKYALAYLFRISHPLHCNRIVYFFVSGSHRSERRRRLEMFKQILPFGENGLFFLALQLEVIGMWEMRGVCVHCIPSTSVYSDLFGSFHADPPSGYIDLLRFVSKFISKSTGMAPRAVYANTIHHLNLHCTCAEMLIQKVFTTYSIYLPTYLPTLFVCIVSCLDVYLYANSPTSTGFIQPDIK